MGYPFGAAIKMLILTGARREEVGGMKWSEIDPGKWTLPASRAKNGLDHITPLSAPAMAVLDSVPRIGRSDLVFTTNSAAPVSGWSKAKVQIDRLSGVANWVLHDLRRCSRQGWASRHGSPHRGSVLGHIVKGVGGVYNKASYLREKTEAIDPWAKRVEEIVR